MPRCLVPGCRAGETVKMHGPAWVGPAGAVCRWVSLDRYPEGTVCMTTSLVIVLAQE